MYALKMLSTFDGTLEDFIQEYCKERGIKFNEKAFRVAFSGVEEYTIAHTKILIEVFADLYSLQSDSSR